MLILLPLSARVPRPQYASTPSPLMLRGKGAQCVLCKFSDVNPLTWPVYLQAQQANIAQQRRSPNTRQRG